MLAPTDVKPAVMKCALSFVVQLVMDCALSLVVHEQKEAVLHRRRPEVIVARSVYNPSAETRISQTALTVRGLGEKKMFAILDKIDIQGDALQSYELLMACQNKTCWLG